MKNTLTTPMNNDTCDFRGFISTDSPISDSEQTSTCISLHKFVNTVVSDLLSRTGGDSISIINDVPQEMLVSTNKTILTSITESLLDTIIMKNQANNIQITAKLIGNLTLAHIRSSNAVYDDSMTGSIQKIEPMAESLGGCLTISNSIRKGLSVAFTFVND